MHIENTIPFNDVALKSKQPGNIVCVFGNNNFIVETGDGYIYINKYRLERNIKLESGRLLRSFTTQIKIGNAINGIKYSECYNER